MIDAYEIGIQLALQDGVSGGLAVIARELAEVDRAVAASSAGLVALTRTADEAVRAVRAAAGVRGPAVAAPVPAEVTPPAGSEVRGAEIGVPTSAPSGSPPEPVRVVEVAPAPPAGTAPGVDSAAPQIVPAVDRRGSEAERTASAAVPVSAQVARVDRVGVPRADAETRSVMGGRAAQRGLEGERVRPMPSSPQVAGIPAVPPATEAVAPGPPAAAASAAVVVQQSLAAPASPAGVQRERTVVSRVTSAPAAGPDRADRASGAGQPVTGAVAPTGVGTESVVRERVEMVRPVAMRAAVAHARRERAAPVTPRPPDGGVVGWPVVMPMMSVAPELVNTRGPQVRPAGRRHDRGAAPQPAAPEQGQSSGGTVMLDGRLVGYWLTERMAREASRPPGGTSFFDPRQAPAWTPSGAL